MKGKKKLYSLLGKKNLKIKGLGGFIQCIIESSVEKIQEVIFTKGDVMLRQFGLVLVVVFLFSNLFGCAVDSPFKDMENSSTTTNLDGSVTTKKNWVAEVSEARSLLVNTCMKWKNEKDNKIIDALAANPDKLPLAMTIMHRDTMSMVKNVAGKGDNECSVGSPEFDAFIAYVTEQSKTNRKGLEVFGTTVQTLSNAATIIGVAKLVGDSAGTHTDGDGNTNVGGDNTTTTTTTTETTIGEAPAAETPVIE